MAGLGLAGGYGAGAASATLGDILKQRFIEQLQRQQAAQAQQRIDLEGQRVAEEQRQHGITNTMAAQEQPYRIRQMAAQATNTENAPLEAQKGRDFTASQSTAAHDFTAGEAEKARAFQGGQTESAHAFTAGEAEKGRTFTHGENVAREANALRIANVHEAGTTNPTADANIEAVADAIVNGQQPPETTGLYRQTLPLRAALAKRGYDLTHAKEDWMATQKHLATLNGANQVRLRQATEFVAQSVPLVSDLSTELTKAMPRGQFPIFNRAALAAATNGLAGPQAQMAATKLNAQIADMQSELAVMYRGGNASTDEALKKASQMLQSDWSEPQLKAALDLIDSNVKIRRNSIRAAGVIAGPNNPYAPDLSGSGGNPPAPPAGAAGGGTAPQVEDWVRDPKTGKMVRK